MTLSTVDDIDPNSYTTIPKEEVKGNNTINVERHVIAEYHWQTMAELSNKTMVRLGTYTQNEIHVHHV